MALLKTLEEPPSDSVIIMTAISEKSLPETILSRAQKIKLSPIPAEDMEKVLAKEFTPEEIKKVTGYASGSIGRAKNLIENSSELEKIEKLYGDAESLFSSKSIVERFKLIEKYDKAKNLRELFDIFSLYVFEGINAMTGKKTDERFEGILDTDGQLQLLALSHKILKIYADLDYNINLRLAMEGVILEYLVYG